MIYTFHIFYKQQCIFYLSIPYLNEGALHPVDSDLQSSGNIAHELLPQVTKISHNTTYNRKNTVQLITQPKTYVQPLPEDSAALNPVSQLFGGTSSSHIFMKEHTQKDEKLLSGFLIGFKAFCQMLVPNDSPQTSFNTFTTPYYRLHYLESLTGYKFVFFTSPEVPSLKKELEYISTHLFIDNAVMSPNFRVGKSVKYTPFNEKIQSYLKFLESNLLKPTLS